MATALAFPGLPNSWQRTGKLQLGPLMGWLENEEYSKLILELSAYGLSLNQAKVYLFLLTNGITSARPIATSLGLHRVEVYRKLRELEELGLVEIYLSSPKRYSATEPKEAL